MWHTAITFVGLSGHCESKMKLANGKNGHQPWQLNYPIIFGRLRSGFRTQRDRVCQREAPPKIVFLLTIHDAIDRQQTFANVQHIYIKIIDSQSHYLLFHHDFSADYTTETALVVGELSLKEVHWYIAPGNHGFAGGLDTALVKYGLMKNLA